MARGGDGVGGGRRGRRDPGEDTEEVMGLVRYRTDTDKGERPPSVFGSVIITLFLCYHVITRLLPRYYHGITTFNYHFKHLEL